MGIRRMIAMIFQSFFVLLFLFCRSHAELNKVDIEIERSFATPYAQSPLLPQLLQSLRIQKNSPDTEDFFSPEYDYIIVGAGSAGSALAARLSEDPAVSVLLLEAGGQPPYLIDIPVIAGSFLQSPIDWNYTTVPQRYTGAGLVNRVIHWPRGKALGGTSVHNGMVHIRGNKEDFNQWARNGSTGWSYEEVLPYFIKMEDTLVPEFTFNGYRGVNGPLTAERPRYSSPLKAAFYEAGRQMGYPILDSNGPEQLGFNDFQSTTRIGQRCSAAKAYLVPVENRINLDIVIHAHVNKILIKNRVAIGVEFNLNNRLHQVFARKEIISSAGSVNSPKLLMLSGIGPRDHLANYNIPVIVDLPVGLNLQDHPAAFMLFTLSDSIPLFPEQVMDPNNIVDYINNKKGPLASNEGMVGMAFLKNDPKAPLSGKPDYQIYFISSAILTDPIGIRNVGITNEVYTRVFEPYASNSSFSCISQIIHPKSRGSVRLQSANPYDSPLIDPNFFENYDDMQDVVAGMKKCLELAYSEPLQKLGARVFETVYPGCESYAGDLDSYLECQVRSVVFTTSHGVGTCKMGSPRDPTTVVDPRLRVKGIKGLRVVDGSIMPTVTSGNTNVPIIMIGEKAADIIKADNAY